jgi:hypothetical protein
MAMRYIHGTGGRSYWVAEDGRVVETYHHEEMDDWVEGPTCSICDGLGHGYPGGPPCPLEDRGYNSPDDGHWW